MVARHLVNTTNDLKLQGGDITRDLYKWTNEHENAATTTTGMSPIQTQIHQPPPAVASPIQSNPMNNFDSKRKRSMSFSAISVDSFTNNNNTETNNSPVRNNNNIPVSMMTTDEMRAPGGFRRSFIIQRQRRRNPDGNPNQLPNFFTRNFIEFLTLYGHFAGEDLSESEEELEEGEEEGLDEEEVIESETESTALLSPTTSRRHKNKHKSSTFRAILLLLKSFVGTGVLFLPKAFHNGGYGFSSLSLFFCALISYGCFLTLIQTKDKVKVDGYGDMGQIIYGKKMKFAILWSIVLSQIGFSAAYTVFTATNLQVFCENVFFSSSSPSSSSSLAPYILLQQLVFVPLSLTRNIAKLSGTALIADLFILLGLVYVYFYSTSYIIKNGISSKTMLWLNKSDWSLFIGTAIFTFEGIGLLIPIQESMSHPQHFSKCLSMVMCIVTVIFISCGLLCYSAFGSKVETVVLLNFPHDSPYTLMVQLLYALAILLSTPLQLFPAIKILENWCFPISASGKNNPKVKWLKNYFRCIIVLLTAFIAYVGANDLDKFVSLVGSFACIPLIYIYPPLLHLKAYWGEQTILRMVLDSLVLIFGVAVMGYTSWQTIAMWLH